MQKLSTSAKQAIIQKALEKDGRTLKEIAEIHNIGLATLGRWLKAHRENGIIASHIEHRVNKNISVAERFQHLMATASLDEAAMGIYCREKGLYSFQLSEWKEAFMKQKSAEKQQSSHGELKRLQAENKQLKQEIRRKDSALAEATALLILKKKAALIWGDNGDD